MDGVVVSFELCPQTVIDDVRHHLLLSTHWHRSDCAMPKWWRLARQVPSPVRNRFRRVHGWRGRSKPGGRTAVSGTRPWLTTEADTQASQRVNNQKQSVIDANHSLTVSMNQPVCAVSVTHHVTWQSVLMWSAKLAWMRVSSGSRTSLARSMRSCSEYMSELSTKCWRSLSYTHHIHCLQSPSYQRYHHHTAHYSHNSATHITLHCLQSPSYQRYHHHTAHYSQNSATHITLQCLQSPSYQRYHHHTAHYSHNSIITVITTVILCSSRLLSS